MKLSEMKCLVLLCSALFLFCFNSKAQTYFVLNPHGCIGTTVNVSAFTGTDTPVSYTWQAMPQGAVFSAANASVTDIHFLQTGNYTVTLNVTLTNGAATYSSAIGINPPLMINVAQSGFTTCIASNSPVYSKPITFTVSGASTYSWQPSGPVIGPWPNNSSTLTVRPAASTCYTVTGYTSVCSGSAVGCVAVIPQFTFGVTPSTAIRCLPDSLALSVVNIQGSAPAPYTYSWTETASEAGSLNNTLAAIVKAAPQNNTTYSVEVMDSRSCVSAPAAVSVTVSNCTGIEAGMLNNSGYRVFPSPASDKLTLQAPDGVQLSGSIINILGQPVQEFTASGTTPIVCDALPKGLYFIKLRGSRVMLRFFKE